MVKKKVISALKGVTVGLLTSGMLLSGAVLAQSATGGGGVGGPGGGGGSAQGVFLYTYDNGTSASQGKPAQGWGDASTEWFAERMEAWMRANGGLQSGNAWADGVGGDRSGIRTACSAALQEASARGGGVRSRVVQVGAAWGSDGGNFLGFGGLSKQDWLNYYNSEYNKKSWFGDIEGYPAEIKQKYIDSIANQFRSEVNELSQPRIICVALNENEPSTQEVNPKYKLSLSTDKGTVFTQAGTTNAVNDIIHASNDRKRTGTVNGKIVMHWDGFGGNPGKSVTKNVAININGDTRSPNFVPADFGWESWPTGKFWFDVTVATQGDMENSINTPDRDPRETWDSARVDPKKELVHTGTDTPLAQGTTLASGMAHDAKMTFKALGAKTVTVTDIIKSENVFIGAADKDDTSKVTVKFEDGTTVNADVKITRANGETRVSATLTGLGDKFSTGTYVMRVPVYAKDGDPYTIADIANICYGGGTTTCDDSNKPNNIPGKETPDPDKAWVLDEQGALVTNDPEWTNKVGADTKTFVPGEQISAVVNGRVNKKLAENLDSYEIVDDWSDAAQFIDFNDASKHKVFYQEPGGTFVDVTDQFTVTNDGTVTKAVAKDTFLSKTKGLAEDGLVKLVLNGNFRTDYDTDGELVKMINKGYEIWNGERRDTNEPPVFTTTPDPDKAWVLDEQGALVTNDPEWTNKVGVDNKVFLMNDAVAAVANGKIPQELARNLTNYVIADDWSDAEQYIDFTDVSKAKVYVQDASGKFVDVTSQFDIKLEGTTTIATAKQEFLDTTKEGAKERQVKLVIQGNFRTDYDTDGELVKMVNKGYEIWNDTKRDTNEPPVYTWTPDPNKQVLGSNDQSGDNTYEDINGKGVLPGQKLEYSVGVDLRVPENTPKERGVKSLAVRDTFDPQFEPNKQSVEFWDSRDPQNPRPVAKSDYKVVWDDAKHEFTATFTDEWLQRNLGPNSEWKTKGWLTMRFTGTVKVDTELGTQVANQAFQIINGAETETEIPVVKIPPVEPDKESLSTDMIDIDEKKVRKDEKILYRLTLDGGLPKEELAYHIHKLGMVDDFDEEYLSVTEKDIKVTNKQTGEDVTAKFNIQIIDGKAYIFAKQVDSETNVGVLKGEPQPANLAEYAVAPIIFNQTPLIDQDLLGQDYWVLIEATVQKYEEGYTIYNSAEQIYENSSKQTKIVSNPLYEINPKKDVVIEPASGDQSIDGQEVKLYNIFNYRLNSSVIPANRAYDATEWSITDEIDRVHDYVTGNWAIYASTDIYNGEELVFKKGDLIEDNKSESKYFTVTFDEETYTYKIEATKAFLDLVNSRDDLEHAYSAYIQVERIAPSERVENTLTESFNNASQKSNVVWTHTPENPSIDVEKYTYTEGEEKGDRDNVEDAYTVAAKDGASEDVEVGFKITNTGDTPLVDVTIQDNTHEGTYGSVDNIMCVDPKAVQEPETTVGGTEGETAVEPTETVVETHTIPVEAEGAEAIADEDYTLPAQAITTLEVGQTVYCKGVLKTEPGMVHSDTVTATGKSIFTGTVVKDEDDWHAKVEGEIKIDVEKYTLEEGREKGDRDHHRDALEVNDDKTEIAFDITNTGDVTLTDIQLDDVTTPGTTGKVTNIKMVDGRELSEITLRAGETVTLVGTLEGVEPGTVHEDKATVTGSSVFDSTKKVTDEDTWNARTPDVVEHHPESLASTGAQGIITLMALMGAAITTGGVLMEVARRKKSA